MGNYIAKADILKRMTEAALIQLTDEANAGVVDDVKVDAAIADAEGEADGYLSVRYKTPVSPVPAVVVSFVVDMTVYRLYSLRQGPTDDVIRRYNDAVRFFRAASQGTVSLGVDMLVPDNSRRDVDIQGNNRVFTRSNMEGF